MTILLALLLQTWHELKFDLGGPEDVETFPWSVPVSMAVALAIAFLVWRARRNYTGLPELPAVNADPPADVAVVIPARNHESTIARCLKSLHPYRAVVVDDNSRDRTVLQAKECRAEVIDAPTAPRGVLARPNAYAAGEQLVDTNYVLFADADTWYAPNFVASAARYATENELVLLSPFLKQEDRSVTGRILTPFASVLYFSGVNPRHAQDVLQPGTYANGQCMFFLRSAYEFFGGYRSVQTSPMEDIAIAEKVKRHRMKIRLMRAEHLGSVERPWSRRNTLRVMRPSGSTTMLALLISLLSLTLLPLAAWLVWQEQLPFLAPLFLVPAFAFAPWYGWGGALLYIPAAWMFFLRLIRDTLSRKTTA